MRERSIAIAILLIVTTAVLADLSPDVYKDLQRKAPEVLYIQVSSVNVHRRFAKPSSCSFFDFEVIREVKVEARVIRIVRSGTGIRAGDVIEIDYLSISSCSGVNGPRSIPMLRNGDRVYAFLARRGRTKSFEPAARGATFSGSIGLAVTGLLSAGMAAAETPAPKQYQASTFEIREASGPIHVDVSLDEEAWKTATTIPLAYEWNPGDNRPSPTKPDVLLRLL